MNTEHVHSKELVWKNISLWHSASLKYISQQRHRGPALSYVATVNNLEGE